MKPPPFAYFAPDSLEAALSLLGEWGDEAKVLAGGQSLIPTLNFRLSQPAALIDLNRIPQLAGVTTTPAGGLRLGAMTRQRTAERHSLVARHDPLLAEMLPHIAHPQIRNRGTLGGSLVHADPAAELPVWAVAVEARLLLERLGQQRWLAAPDFFQGLFSVDLAPDELVTVIEAPAWPAGAGYAFLEVARRVGDYALAGVAVRLTLDSAGRCQSARLVYLHLGDRPLAATRAAGLLLGEVITPSLIEAVVELSTREEIDPAGNVHASAAFQRHLARTLTRRAILLALQRAHA